jgi:soluble lytic murein transglycosylase-like protein
MSALNDLTAVEYRIAELSGSARPAVRNAAPEMSNAAQFAALLGSSVGASDAASAPCIVPEPVLERIIARACAANGTDPALVKAVVVNESGFDASATSATGARGLMQLMPDTAASVGVNDAYDPAQNVAGGTKYLGALIRHFGGNLPLALAAYNAGPAAVEGGRTGAETSDYVRSVLASYAAYRGETPARA